MMEIKLKKTQPLESLSASSDSEEQSTCAMFSVSLDDSIDCSISMLGGLQRSHHLVSSPDSAVVSSVHNSGGPGSLINTSNATLVSAAGTHFHWALRIFALGSPGCVMGCSHASLYAVTVGGLYAIPTLAFSLRTEEK